MAQWLIKSEPDVYPFAQLEKDKKTTWDGVRNFEARNNLRAMKKGELCLFYHSNEGREIVGIARVLREAYRDPTSPKDEDWSAVDVEPVMPLAAPVPLGTVKGQKTLSKMKLVTRSRISVTPVTERELAKILELAKTELPAGG